MLKYILFLIFLQFTYSIIDTVKELNLEKYQYRWFQIYGNKFDQTFQKYGKCITADYNINLEGNVSILNSEYSLTNQLEQIKGYAYYKDNINTLLNPGDLTVHLDGVSHDSPYLIINLGPQVDYLYDWAIVTDPIQLSLFVLTRDIERFNIEYEEQVLNILQEKGFKNILKISHTDCNYIPEPTLF
jgi:lipocalin